MNHGDSRNHRTETEMSHSEWQTPQGPVTVPTLSHTYTVSERWCEVCNEWVTAKGIMGALLCPECNTPWHPDFRE